MKTKVWLVIETLYGDVIAAAYPYTPAGRKAAESEFVRIMQAQQYTQGKGDNEMILDKYSMNQIALALLRGGQQDSSVPWSILIMESE